jgi:hypothetical protein
VVYTPREAASTALCVGVGVEANGFAWGCYERLLGGEIMELNNDEKRRHKGGKG